MSDGDPTVNSTEAQAAVTAALDSVTIIDNVVANNDAVAGQTTAEKADDADRNYRHIEIMMEKSWFSSTATTSQKSSLNGAISAGKAYYEANK
jgi:hypothetical protein